MKKGYRSLSATELFENLQQDKFEQAAAVTLVGMAKKPEGKEKAILFSLGADCSNWVSVPLGLIEDAEVLRLVPCRDHSHPLIRLNLKVPETPEAQLFSSLLNAMQPGPEGPQGDATAFAGRQLVDEWGDPVCGPGTRKRCYPAVCPNPSGRGTIWCTKCRCEPVWPPDDLDFFGRFHTVG